ncbi:hypothetical protein [Chryseobacterium arthrosphaerae]|uniref:hypothetical protein n=1 Tax=Chryseobacterium arthrosphaerae TaxID=651561 RepID=UPI00241E6760|nr:hypothetical protein [Chryseobacterium arthrosphaerae]
MKKLEYFLSLIKNPNPESLKLSMADTHYPGLFSLVIEGTEFGKLTRAFIADKKIRPYAIQLHSHRYPIKLTVLQGNVKHYVAFRSEVTDLHTTTLSEFEYRSPLNGGTGLKYLKETNVIIKDYSLPIGSTSEMNENDIHTVSCSAGSIWIVEEQGFKNNESRVLGVPFITEGLYNSPGSFQINDKVQQVRKALKTIIIDYDIIDLKN